MMVEEVKDIFEEIEKEKTMVAFAMKEHGGSFVQALGEALLRADDENTRRIKNTWPEYWGKYSRFAKNEEE